MGLLKDVPVNKVKEFETEYLEYLELKHRDILDNLKEGVLTSQITDVLKKVTSDIAAKYKP